MKKYDVEVSETAKKDLENIISYGVNLHIEIYFIMMIFLHQLNYLLKIQQYQFRLDMIVI